MSSFTNEKLKIYREYLKNKNVSVLGVGISNIPLIRFLLNSGANVKARDRKSIEELKQNVDLNIEDMIKSGVNFVTGEQYLSNLTEDVIFKTPGLRYDTKEILCAAKQGSVITSEMEAFLALCPSKIIAITGSDGKTTTTTLVSELLKEGGYRVHLGGNIGKPLLSEIDAIEPNDFTVLELSSFQLHTIGKFENHGFPFAQLSFPDVAIITNISPNHLNWHIDYAEYIDAKKAIFRYMKKDGLLVTNYDCSLTREIATQVHDDNGTDIRYFSSSEPILSGYSFRENGIYNPDGVRILEKEDIFIPGKHNIENYMAAIAAIDRYVTIQDILKVANKFKGVEHRLEFVREKGGVRFYNSSIDSSPTRTIAALSCFEKKIPKNLIVILGGQDKHIPFAPMGPVICEKAKAAFIAVTDDGKAAEEMKLAILNSENFKQDDTELFLFENWEETMKSACAYAKSGDCVVLSPACTSFDAFRNFEERGQLFKKIVNEL